MQKYTFNGWTLHTLVDGEAIAAEIGSEFYYAPQVDEVLKRQASAALTGMNAATAISSGQLQQAHRLRAESSPEALESERQANAILTNRIDQLQADYDHEKVMRQQCEARIAELEKFISAYAQHSPNCGVNAEWHPCTCGYDKASKALGLTS